MPFRRVAIVGTGLIGGSLGLALRRAWPETEVVGTARRAATVEKALARGAITRGAATAAEAAAGADAVVLCAPVEAVEPALREIGPALAPGAIVTDAASVKAEIVAAAARALPPGARFVGAHPMAGSEKDGIDAADARLYSGAVVVLTPGPRPDAAASAAVRAMWEAVGALVLEMTPEEHDRLVAAVSHLPHVVAAALVNAVGDVAEGDPRTLSLAAGGFRDTTRIASASPALWRTICGANREAIRAVLTLFRRRLDAMESVLGEGVRLEAEFERARRIRGEVPAVARGMLPSAYDVSVDVEDRPGALAEITRILADVGVNILDVEVLRAREEVGGPIRVTVSSEAERARTVEALAARGFRARDG